MTRLDRKRESKARSLSEGFLWFLWWIDIFTALKVIKMLYSHGALDADTEMLEKNIMEEGIGIFRIFFLLPLALKCVEVARICVPLLKEIELQVEQLGCIEQNTKVQNTALCKGENHKFSRQRHRKLFFLIMVVADGRYMQAGSLCK